jgi:hypothetical protein
VAWPTVTESRQADLKGFAGAGVPAFLIEREEIGILGRANRRPANAPTVHVRQRDGRRVDNIDIQLWPASDGLNVDVHGTSRFVVLFHGRRWWEVF